MRILVLDCYVRSALTVLRALDPAYELVGATALGGGGGLPIERWLRSGRLSDVLTCPSPAGDPDRFERWLVETCRREAFDAVVPLESTRLALALARLAERVGDEVPTRFAVEDASKLGQLGDKWGAHELCRELGVPTPRTVLPTPGDPASVELEPPLIAKPRLAEGARGIVFLPTFDEIARFVVALPRASGGVSGPAGYVLQEVIDGTLHDACLCAQDGRLVAALTQQRLVGRYPFGGPGIVNQTTDEPELVELAERLARRLRWNGPLLVDFIRDRDGRPFLLECNPRLWGTLELTVRAGLDVPQQTVDVLVRGVPVAEAGPYAVGMVFKWVTPAILVGSLRKARTLRGGLSRLASILRPYRPGPTVTSLRARDLPHLAGMHVLGRRHVRSRRRAGGGRGSLGPQRDSMPSA